LWLDLPLLLLLAFLGLLLLLAHVHGTVENHQVLGTRPIHPGVVLHEAKILAGGQQALSHLGVRFQLRRSPLWYDAHGVLIVEGTLFLVGPNEAGLLRLLVDATQLILDGQDLGDRGVGRLLLANAIAGRTVLRLPFRRCFVTQKRPYLIRISRWTALRVHFHEFFQHFCKTLTILQELGIKLVIL